MRRKKSNLELTMTVAVFLVTILLTGAPAAAQTDRILHAFSNNGEGESPYMGLVFDTAGNLYGTTGAAAPMARARCSNCRPMAAEAGRRRCCIILETEPTANRPGAAACL
jgi:hypothetical protein